MALAVTEKKFPLQSTVNSDTIHTQSIHCLLSKKLLNMANFAFNSQLKHFLTSTNWPSCDLKYSDKYFTGCCRFFYTQKNVLRQKKCVLPFHCRCCRYHTENKNEHIRNGIYNLNLRYVENKSHGS